MSSPKRLKSPSVDSETDGLSFTDIPYVILLRLCHEFIFFPVRPDRVDGLSLATFYGYFGFDLTRNVWPIFTSILVVLPSEVDALSDLSANSLTSSTNPLFGLFNRVSKILPWRRLTRLEFLTYFPLVWSNVSIPDVRLSQLSSLSYVAFHAVDDFVETFQRFFGSEEDSSAPLQSLTISLRTGLVSPQIITTLSSYCSNLRHLNLIPRVRSVELPSIPNAFDGDDANVMLSLPSLQSLSVAGGGKTSLMVAPVDSTGTLSPRFNFPELRCLSFKVAVDPLPSVMFSRALISEWCLHLRVIRLVSCYVQWDPVIDLFSSRVLEVLEIMSPLLMDKVKAQEGESEFFALVRHMGNGFDRVELPRPSRLRIIKLCAVPGITASFFQECVEDPIETTPFLEALTFEGSPIRVPEAEEMVISARERLRLLTSSHPNLTISLWSEFLTEPARRQIENFGFELPPSETNYDSMSPLAYLKLRGQRTRGFDLSESELEAEESECPIRFEFEGRRMEDLKQLHYRELFEQTQQSVDQEVEV